MFLILQSRSVHKIAKVHSSMDTEIQVSHNCQGPIFLWTLWADNQGFSYWVGKVSIELPRSSSFLYVSIELPRSNSFVDTTNESEFKQPKSVHKTAKVRSFCGFGLLGLKSVHKTA